MRATKLKANELFGDDLPITAFQIKRIRQNCGFDEGIKEEWVQWVTGNVNCRSLKSLTQAQAKRIIRQQTGETSPETGENWGYFDKNNHQHRYIAVLLRNADIVVKNERWGKVADMQGWLSRFLQSKRSPVQKPLKKMTSAEVSKIIVALEGVAIWKNSV